MSAQQPYDQQSSDNTGGEGLDEREEIKRRKLDHVLDQAYPGWGNEAYQSVQRLGIESQDDSGYLSISEVMASVGEEAFGRPCQAYSVPVDLAYSNGIQHTGLLVSSSSQYQHGSYATTDCPSALSKYDTDILSLARAASSPYTDTQPMSSMAALQPYLGSTAQPNGLHPVQGQGQVPYGNLSPSPSAQALSHQPTGSPQDFTHQCLGPPPPPPRPMPSGFNPYGMLVPGQAEMTHLAYAPYLEVDDALDEGEAIIARFEARSHAARAGHAAPPNRHSHQPHRSSSVLPGAPMYSQRHHALALELRAAPASVQPPDHLPIRSVQAALTNTQPHAPASLLPPRPPPPPPTAAKLLGGSHASLRMTTLLPWGYQRIKTFERLALLATKSNAPIPSFSDENVKGFFSAHASKVRFDHMIKSTAPPIDVDIRLLGKVRITTAELLTFFPLHIKWYDYIYRFIQNGWKVNDIAGYINYARQTDKADAIRANSLIAYQQDADEAIINNRKQGSKSRPLFKTTCFTTEKWMVPVDKKWNTLLRVCDYFLIDLADGVVNYPQNEHARLLTKAVQHAFEHDHHDVKISGIGAYAQKHGLGEGLEPMAWRGLKDGEHPDKAAKQALKVEIEEGRNRPKILHKKDGDEDDEEKSKNGEDLGSAAVERSADDKTGDEVGDDSMS
ncbi:hypothetical protein BDV96DRAFT_670336 [Lophiotrema nucula]|uniref:Uncharacterized protein n=1 Tax=Lophiotrema nucula TaxID=690887 RepID=A0A6A5YRI5_9PLEO|nr:hypothetical protein BDV96DRAFT_670336 [Lophiotrema nucula]